MRFDLASGAMAVKAMSGALDQHHENLTGDYRF